MVPGRLLDYPTPIMLSEMMFGSMPIKSQADGLKVYCIPKEQACCQRPPSPARKGCRLRGRVIPWVEEVD